MASHDQKQSCCLEKVVWFGQRCSDALPLLSRGACSLIVSCDYGRTGEWIEGCGVPIISLEKQSRVRQSWNYSSIEHLLCTVATSPVLLQTLQQQGSAHPAWLPYTNTPTVDSLASQCNARVLGSAFAIRSKAENKIEFRRRLRRLKLPVIPTLELREANETNYDSIVAEYGLPFVLQSAIGSSGVGTCVVNSRYDFNDKIIEGKHVRYPAIASPFIQSYSLNQHAVIYLNGTVAYPPSVQLVGCPACSRRDLGYCGNDFASALQIERNIVQECNRQTQIIGDSLIVDGFSGLCGIDYIVTSSGHVLAVELNARFQNSTPLLCYVVSEYPQCDPICEHIRACLESV